MTNIIKGYVRVVDKMNYLIGRVAMFTIFIMVGVMFYSAITKTFFTPALWTYEFAQFLMVAYFLVGGAYSIQLHGHVRMDLLYGSWSERTQNRWDSVTSLITIAYLILLLYGSIDSLIYAISYVERSYSIWRPYMRSYSIWRPYMWPIKLIMTLGIFLMLLQLISQFFKDLAGAKGEILS